MGIGYTGVLALLKLKQEGCDFTHVATLGRHYLYLTPKQMQKAFKKFGLSLSHEACAAIFENAQGGDQGYQETLFAHLGAENVTSFDVSNYEKCRVIHDFNLPLPEKFHHQFTVVFDFGSCEHVFNFPQAVHNLMQLCQIGGHVIMETPHNNFGEHGLYQFSAELFFSIFNQNNGFDLKQMYLYSMRCKQAWFALTDRPNRLELKHRSPTLLFFWAEKEASVAHLTVREHFYENLYQGSTPFKPRFIDKIKNIPWLQPARILYRRLRTQLRTMRTYHKTTAWKNLDS